MCLQIHSPEEACFCDCSRDDRLNLTSRWSVVGGALTWTVSLPSILYLPLESMVPLWNLKCLINWKRQCWNSETWPNSDNSQIHRCSTRTRINFSNYLEVDRTGCREPGGADWPSGEVISASQSAGVVLGGTRIAWWWLVSSIHFRL